MFRYPEDAATTLRLMCRRWRWLERRPVKLPTLKVDKKAAQRVFSQHRTEWLPASATESCIVKNPPV